MSVPSSAALRLCACTVPSLALITAAALMVRNEERVLHAPPELDLRLELHLQRFFTDVVFVDHDVVAEPQTKHLEDNEKRVDLFETS